MIPFLLAVIALNAPATHASPSAESRSYRSYLVEIQVASGELKNAEIQVAPGIRVVRMGDPEIVGHGHYDYSVNGAVVEAGKSCNFDLLLSQGGGEEQSTSQILASGADRKGLLSLCSGLKLEVGSVRSLLTSDTIPLSLRISGLSQVIGKGTAVFQGMKTIKEDTCADPWHCPPDYIGPRH